MNKIKRASREYVNIHSWLRTHHTGLKKSCEICKTQTNLQFALLIGKEHKKNIKNYRILCGSCHYKYDSANGRRKKYHKPFLVRLTTKDKAKIKKAALLKNTTEVEIIRDLIKKYL